MLVIVVVYKVILSNVPITTLVPIWLRRKYLGSSLLGAAYQLQLRPIILLSVVPAYVTEHSLTYRLRVHTTWTRVSHLRRRIKRQLGLRALSTDLFDLHHWQTFFIIPYLLTINVKVVMQYFQLKLRVVRTVFVCALKSRWGSFQLPLLSKLYSLNLLSSW